MSLKELEKRIKGAIEDQSYGYHIFANENRRLVFRELTKRPCRTASSLSSALGMDTKVILWHLSKLREATLITTWKSGRTYYWPVELVRTKDLELFKILNSTDARKILLHAHKGCIEIKNIPVKSSTLYRYLKIYADMGLIDISGYGKKYMCGTELLKKMVEKYDLIGKKYKKTFIKKIETRGFSIRIMGTVNYEVKIEVSGMENFTMGIFISPLRTAMEVHQ